MIEERGEMMLMRCNEDDEEVTHVQEVKHVRYEPKGPHVDDKVMK